MRVKGRAPTKKPRILELRPLTREDLAHLQPGRPRALTGIVQRFRETHHRVAALIAMGMRNEQVADLTGYSLARIYTLRADPAFEELIAQKRANPDPRLVEAYDDYRTTAVRNMVRAEHHIEDALDDADSGGERIPIRTLLAIASDRADRFGYGKHTTQTNVNIDFARRLEKAQAASGKSNVIDAKVIHPSTPGSGLTLVQSSTESTPAQEIASPAPSASTSRANLGAQLKSLVISMDLRRA